MNLTFKQHLEHFWHRIQPHPMLPPWRRYLQWAGIGIGGAFIGGFILLFLSTLILIPSLPSIEKGEDFLQAQSTLIMDREGNILYAIHGEENRKLVTLRDISPYLVDATLSIEDRNFYNHMGFALPCYIKAVGHELFGIGIRRGCSTITQQLVKNLFLTPEQTYTRKLEELILAVLAEFRFSKDEILQLYLNEIPYGNNAYGSELAAQTYFNKPAKDLTLTESAVLAALPKAPTRYSPYGNNRNSHLLVEFTPEQLAKRSIENEEDLKLEEYARGLIGADIDLGNGKTVYIPGRVDLVLKAMYENGTITEEEKAQAITESHQTEFKKYRENIKTPHFVLYVKELIEQKYGKEMVEQGGLKIYTTLDPKLQKFAEEAVTNQKERNATQFKASNAALVAAHPQTGQILAMVGSADYFDETIDGNVNIATRYRAPGSSFKPFVYALTFLKGYSPATVVYDVRTQFGPGLWPNNYDGNFVGPIAIRKALGQSRNIPAIKAYFLAGQEEELIPFINNFGLKLDESLGYGWPLALGSGEVRLIDMVQGYSVFANSGIRKNLNPILKIENRAGEVLEQWEDKPGTAVVDPQAAYLITDILSDTSVNLGTRLTIPGQVVAAKTGTSNKKNDRNQNVPNNNWAMGYSTKLVTGVWVGNADGSELAYNADGYTTAAPIWNEFMSKSLADLSPEAFPVPQGITQVTVSKLTGLLPGEHTPPDMITTEKFATFNIPTQTDDRYKLLKIDKFTGLIANEYSPQWSIEEKAFIDHRAEIEKYTFWQEGIDAWLAAEQEKPENAGAAFEKAPTEIDNIHTLETILKSPTIAIVSPSTFIQVGAGERIPVEVQFDAQNGFDKVEFYLNDQLQFTSPSSRTGTMRIPVNAKSGKEYTITAYIYDGLGYRAGSSIEVRVR